MKLLLTYLSVAILFISCGSEDEEPSVIFESYTLSKKVSFIEEPIILKVVGENFDEVELIFTNDKVSYKKIDKTTFEISATEALTERIRIRLVNGTDVQAKIIILGFIEHGVFGSTIVEGIRLDFDKTDRLLEILGEPDAKSISTITTGWFYSLGVSFTITNATNTISFANIYTYSTAFNINDNSVLIKAYPYLINKTFDFSDFGRNKIDKIVDNLGLPSFIYEGVFPNPIKNFKSELRAPSASSRGLYEYVYFNDGTPQASMHVRFFSNDINDYKGESISSILIN